MFVPCKYGSSKFKLESTEECKLMDVQKLPLLTFAHFVELWCFRQPFSLNFCEEEGKTTVVRVFCRKKKNAAERAPPGVLYIKLYTGTLPSGTFPRYLKW